jgi:receptor protein-tyrosine kinase
MSIIEQAARRLEELKRAGIVLPPGVGSTAGPGQPAHTGQAAAPDAAAVGAAAALAALAAVPAAAAPASTTVSPLGGLANAQAAAQAAAQAVTALAERQAGVVTTRTGVPPLSVVAPMPAPQPAHVVMPPVVQPEPAAPPAPPRRSREVRVDLDRLNASGYLVPGQSRTALAEQMRIVKRPLLANARGEGAEPVARANLIQVVSAVPGEGKTFVAMNLAMSIAMEVDHSVLLVDADVLRPSVLKRFGLEESAPGLLDVLSDPAIDLADVMLRTNVPKLSILPAGTANLTSTELLASSAMERLLDELAAKYTDRIIVFDAPPLIPTTESRVLASRVGQVVMVVEADATSRVQAAQAYAALEECPVVLSVLNKSRQRSSEAYGYYYEG